MGARIKVVLPSIMFLRSPKYTMTDTVQVRTTSKHTVIEYPLGFFFALSILLKFSFKHFSSSEPLLCSYGFAAIDALVYYILSVALIVRKRQPSNEQTDDDKGKVDEVLFQPLFFTPSLS